jgi:putrescine aminotransferase
MELIKTRAALVGEDKREADIYSGVIIGNYEEFVNPAMAKLFRFMGLSSVESQASGVHIWDVHGRKYLDCLAGYGVFNVGHCHPKVIGAVQKQLAKMPLSSKVLFSAPQGRLAAKLAEITPGDLQYSFFCNSGAEAVEGALKVARLATGRSNIIATTNGFHGKTLGALSATGRDVFRRPCEPLLPGFTHVPFGDVAAVELVCNESTAGVLVEPIQGEGGIVVPTEGYLTKLKAICQKQGALLILDEVQTGLGRTGKMFACEHEEVVPDILVLAKALGGGVMPIGAFVARPEVWEVLITNPFLHTSTFGGNPLACSAALATIDVVVDEKLAHAAAHKGVYFLQQLKQLQTRFPDVLKEARGRGLLLGLELTEEGLGGFVMAEMFDAGILVAYTLNNPKVIRLEPPLIISIEQIDQVVGALSGAFAKARESL